MVFDVPWKTCYFTLKSIFIILLKCSRGENPLFTNCYNFLISCVVRLCSLGDIFLQSSFDRTHGTYVCGSAFWAHLFVRLFGAFQSYNQHDCLINQHSTFNIRTNIQHTSRHTHTHTCTIQIEHCHFVVNRITYNIQRIICVPILVQVLMQCCISPSFIIIKIDVEHLMRKLLFHDEFTNRTSICR